MQMARDNIATLNWALSAAEVDALDAAAASIDRGMVQNIFQTA
jgi:pyridoxine 4-dehydrogenase